MHCFDAIFEAAKIKEYHSITALPLRKIQNIRNFKISLHWWLIKISLIASRLSGPLKLQGRVFDRTSNDRRTLVDRPE